MKRYASWVPNTQEPGTPKALSSGLSVTPPQLHMSSPITSTLPVRTLRNLSLFPQIHQAGRWQTWMRTQIFLAPLGHLCEQMRETKRILERLKSVHGWDAGKDKGRSKGPTWSFAWGLRPVSIRRHLPSFPALLSRRCPHFFIPCPLLGELDHTLQSPSSCCFW